MSFHSRCTFTFWQQLGSVTTFQWVSNILIQISTFRGFILKTLIFSPKKFVKMAIIVNLGKWQGPEACFRFHPSYKVHRHHQGIFSSWDLFRPFFDIKENVPCWTHILSFQGLHIQVESIPQASTLLMDMRPSSGSGEGALMNHSWKDGRFVIFSLVVKTSSPWVISSLALMNSRMCWHHAVCRAVKL